MNPVVLNGYFDELSKLAGIGSFIAKGVTQLGRLGRGVVKGKGGNFGRGVKTMYQRAGGGAKGVGAVAKKFAPAAAVAGGAGLAGYGALKGVGSVMGD